MFRAVRETSDILAKISDKYGVFYNFPQAYADVLDGKMLLGGSKWSLDYTVKLRFMNE